MPLPYDLPHSRIHTEDMLPYPAIGINIFKLVLTIAIVSLYVILKVCFTVCLG